MSLTEANPTLEDLLALDLNAIEAARMVYHDTNLFGGVTASSYRMG